MTDHTPRRQERPGGPASANVRYRCSCGYVTGWRTYPGHAEQAWRQHVKDQAKEKAA